MLAYKLFRKKKNGELTSLFIDKKRELPLEWMLDAKLNPTKGFAERFGWHCLKYPIAPHLSKKGRVWCVVRMVGATEIQRPEAQGGIWYLAKHIEILGEIAVKE